MIGFDFFDDSPTVWSGTGLDDNVASVVFFLKVVESREIGFSDPMDVRDWDFGCVWMIELWLVPLNFFILNWVLIVPVIWQSKFFFWYLVEFKFLFGCYCVL